MFGYLRAVELFEKHGATWRDSQSTVDGCPHMASGIVKDTLKLLTQLRSTLDYHLNPDAIAKARDFPFVRDPALRNLIERDFREITLKLFPGESWKSVVVIAGSILEALLHDLLTRDQVRITAAQTFRCTPQRPRNKPPSGPRQLCSDLLEDQWFLNDYIAVADKLTLLPPAWRAALQEVLRDFRNYIHPRKELKAPTEIGQGEAYLSVGVLIRLCDHIEANHP